MNDIPAASQIKKSRRIEFIDLLRGWAVIVMIETHVMNATLMQSATEGPLFQWIKFVNGLVAPSFLFASGLAYAVTTRRKMHDYLSFGPPLYKQFRRLIFVVMIGYLLHLPKFNFMQLLHEATDRSWQIFFQADILQCIGVSLLIIQALLLILRRERLLYHVVISLAVLVLLLTPFIWGIDFQTYFPPLLAGYMNGIHFPNFPGFPLFPWAVFLFTGAVFGYFYLSAKDSSSVPSSTYNEGVMMKRTMWIAPGVILLSVLFEPFAAELYPVYDYGKFSPSFVLYRLGLVMLLAAGMFFYERKIGVSSRSAVTLIGRESLIVYSVHLLLIYGNFGKFNFRKAVNNSFGYAEALVATCVLVVLMYLLARVWDYLRTKPVWKRRVEIAIVATLVGVFFFGPGE